MEKLPDDCLSQVFYFLLDDKTSLHASILVNRKWCKIAINFLWRRPFYFVLADKNTVNYTFSRRKRTGMLMEVILSCLTSDENSNNNNIKKIYNLRNSSRTSRARVITEKGPIFNYVGFIRQLDLDDLGLAIAEWAEYCCSQDSSINNETSLQRNLTFATLLSRRITRNSICKSFKNNKSFIKEIAERICKILVTKISRIDSLSVKPICLSRCIEPSIIIRDHLVENSVYKNIINEYMGFITYPGADDCLSKLLEFSWNSCPRSIQVVKELSLVTSSVRKISFDIKNKVEILAFDAMISLIAAQTALVDFEISNFEITNSILMETLARHMNTLTRLSFNCVNISKSENISVIMQFKKLEELEIISCKLESKEPWPLNLANFPNMIVYRIDDVFPTTIAMKDNDTMFEDSGTMLNTFVYNQFQSYNSETTRSIIENIENCTNLTHFECDAEIDSINLLMPIFLLSTRLQTIIIKNRRRSLDMNEMLRAVRLTRLSHLELEGYWRFTSDSLETFLINSNPLLKTLSLHYSNCFEDDHLEVLLRNLSGVLQKIDLKGMTKRLSFDMRKKAHRVVKDFYYGK
ncbi:hypothetical protein Glove_425g22 [Diversispora epigaea]|uniref:F-box domain-containing protein n=1 Tax=Diversispora epigaea TaxID=1348612 RepID=A0A397GZ15_9GLOM|nr:hypothetical protein Glove_425g22 [Diversispora epigaea]